MIHIVTQQSCVHTHYWSGNSHRSKAAEKPSLHAALNNVRILLGAGRGESSESTATGNQKAKSSGETLPDSRSAEQPQKKRFSSLPSVASWHTAKFSSGAVPPEQTSSCIGWTRFENTHVPVPTVDKHSRNLPGESSAGSEPSLVPGGAKELERAAAFGDAANGAERGADADKLSQALCRGRMVQEFLQDTACQLTYYGLSQVPASHCLLCPVHASISLCVLRIQNLYDSTYKSA